MKFVEPKEFLETLQVQLKRTNPTTTSFKRLNHGADDQGIYKVTVRSTTGSHKIMTQVQDYEAFLVKYQEICLISMDALKLKVKNRKKK